MKLQISPPVAIGIVVAVVVLIGGIILLKVQADAGAAASVSKQGQTAGHKMMDTVNQPAGSQPTAAGQAQNEAMQHMRRPGQ